MLKENMSMALNKNLWAEVDHNLEVLQQLLSALIIYEKYLIYLFKDIKSDLT